MSYDETLAQRVREVLAPRRGVEERKMFGGLCFMVNGHMCCGLTSAAFMVRVGKDAFAAALAQPHARPMDFTGRPSAGMVYVDAPGLETKPALTRWVARGLALVDSLPPKKKKAKQAASWPRKR